MTLETTRNRATKIISLCLIACIMALSGQTFAESGFAKHKLVIQVSSDDPRTQTIALNNAANLIKHYGMNDIDIEIVAYGPGLGLLTQESKFAERVQSMTMQNVTMSACGNTMKKVAKKTGKDPELLNGVTVVTAGVARIMELQEEGYAYVRP